MSVVRNVIKKDNENVVKEAINQFSIYCLSNGKEYNGLLFTPAANIEDTTFGIAVRKVDKGFLTQNDVKFSLGTLSSFSVKNINFKILSKNQKINKNINADFIWCLYPDLSMMDDVDFITKNCGIKSGKPILILVMTSGGNIDSWERTWGSDNIVNQDVEVILSRIKEKHNTISEILNQTDKSDIEKIVSENWHTLKHEKIEDIRAWFVRNGFYPRTADEIKKILHKYVSPK